MFQFDDSGSGGVPMMWIGLAARLPRDDLSRLSSVVRSTLPRKCGCGFLGLLIEFASRDLPMSTPHVFRKLGWVAAFLLTVMPFAAPDVARAEFNFARYKETDLDEFLARPRPASGLDIYPMSPLKLDVTLASHGEPCASGMLKRSL
ncbi:hypothetical protein K7461_29765, partial [Pseudomonas fluorescens]|nr:hypothetical protein [Pseudomonas fluorescens]